MQKPVKILITILLIAVLCYFYFFSDTSLAVRTGIFFALIVIYLLYTMNQRLRKIENTIGLLNDPTKEEETLKPLSYRAKVSIDVKWIEIIKWCFPDLKDDDQVWDFVNNLYNNRDLKLNKRKGLYHDSFSFVVFYDGLSGRRSDLVRLS